MTCSCSHTDDWHLIGTDAAVCCASGCPCETWDPVEEAVEA